MSESKVESDLEDVKETTNNVEIIDLEKYKALDKELKKKFGDSYIGVTEKKQLEKINYIPVECLSINRMLGGGLPEGRIIEVFGPASVGKSNFAMHVVASFQKQGKVCFWLDAERAWSDEYALMCGVDIDTLAKFEPDTGNDCLEAVRIAAASGQISLIVVDSIAALVPKDEYDKEVGQTMIGSLARLLSSVLKQIAVLADKHNCTVLLLNQERASNIGGYGPKSSTSGGSALGYYTSVRIDINRTGYIENSAGDKLGIAIKAQTVKNKTFTPFKTAEYNILFPHTENDSIVAGIDIIGNILQLAIDLDIIIKSGSWLTYKDYKCQGLEKFRLRLIEDDTLYDEIYDLVNQQLSSN